MHIPYARTVTSDAHAAAPRRLRPRAVSTVLFAVGVLVDIACVINVPGAAVLTGGADPRSSITSTGMLLVLVVIGCWSTVFFRVRYPPVVVIAGGLLALAGVSYLLGLVAAFVACLRWPHRTRLIAAVAVGTVALFILREALTPWGQALPWLLDEDPVADETQWVLARGILAVLSLGLLSAIVVVRGTRAEASRSKLQAQAQHERADALDAALARQAERERIARDLHDGLGHRLSTLALAAGAFEAQVATAPVDPHLAEWARHVRGQAHLALEDMRGFVGALRSDAPDEAVSLRQLGALVEGVRGAGHRVDLTVILEGMDGVSPASESAAYRIVQEALTNALKHAPGEPVTVTATAAPGAGIRIRVANPLASTPADVAGGGQGITGIRERVAAVGGEVWIGTHEGWFLVDATLP